MIYICEIHKCYQILNVVSFGPLSPSIKEINMYVLISSCIEKNGCRIFRRAVTHLNDCYDINKKMCLDIYKLCVLLIVIKCC